MPLLVLIFIVVPLVELWIIIEVGRSIGVLPTISLLLADSILGAYLLRSQGRTALRRFNEAVNAGRTPHREVLDGILIAVGGTLLLTPGFVTDLFGLTLLIPPTRRGFSKLTERFVRRRIQAGRTVFFTVKRFGQSQRSYDSDSTAHEVDVPQLPRVGSDDNEVT